MIKKKDDREPVEKFYSRFNVEFVSQNVKDYTAICPLCSPEERLDKGTLSIHRTKGTYRCFKCGDTGNIYTFMTNLHALKLKQTTLDHYRELAKARGLTAKVLKLARFAYDEDWGVWLVSYQDQTKYLFNLGVVDPASKFGYRVLKPAQISEGNPGNKLLRPFDKMKLKKDVWVFEGIWDLLAAKAALIEGKVSKTPSLVSTDGATTWTPEMNAIVKGCSLTFFWDDDKAGREDGPKTIMKRISGCSPQFVNWEALGAEPGVIKDVRDLWTTRKKRSADAALELMDLANSASLPEGVPTAPEKSEGFSTNVDLIQPVPKYSQFMETLTKHLYINDSMRRCYEICLASCLSINLPDKPLWVLLIGQASTGKSTLIESFGGSSKYFEYTSKLSAESFVSGWKGGDDISLILKVMMKSLLIGDLTVILNQPIQAQEKLWGLLREAYGGTLKINFGNQDAKEFHNYKFNMIAGVTHAIYAVNNSDMGERFIKIDFAGKYFDEDAHMDAAMRIQDIWPRLKDELRDNLVGFYKHLQENTNFSKPVDISPEIDLKIKSLAKLTTKLRTKVQKDRFEGMISRPVSESPARFATQLRTLAKCLAWVRQEDHVTPDNFKSLQKVAFDSCPGLGLETILYLHKREHGTISSIHKDLGIPKTRVQQITADFRALGVLDYTKVNNGSGSRGRDAMRFVLSENVKDALNDFVDRPRPKKPVKKNSPKPKRLTRKVRPRKANV